MTAKELRLDYFKFYDVENREAAGDIQIKGQFDRRPVKMRIRMVDYFGNAVSKNGEPLYSKHAHLAWHRGLQPAEPPRLVVVENQFGKFEIRTGTGYGILVPTQKVEAGSEFPKELDHYKVYRLLDAEDHPAVVLKLKDQFRTEEVKLRLPQYFAVPVAKRHGEKSYPIMNEKAHLLIFSITSREIQKEIRIKNQIKSTGLKVVRSLMLAAPSVKHEWKQL